MILLNAINGAPVKIIHLLSGGFDSVTMLYDLVRNHQVHCLLVDYRQKHARELWFAEKHCKKLGVDYTIIDLPELGGLTEQSWIVPNRNAILISLAANLAAQKGFGRVTIGSNKDDEAGFPDCRESFFMACNSMLKAAEIPVVVSAPFIDWSKRKIAALAKELGVTETYSCYKGGEKPCGECPACKKMEAACGQ